MKRFFLYKISIHTFVEKHYNIEKNTYKFKGIVFIMKKKAIVMWIIFVVCVISTIALRYFSDRQQIQYETVSAKVISAEKKTLKNRSNGNTYTSYHVTVEYEGKEYELKNAHSTYEYPKGKEITAYLSRGNLYADVAGVKSSTPLFYAYFGFLVGSIVMLCVAINSSVKAKRK